MARWIVQPPCRQESAWLTMRSRAAYFHAVLDAAPACGGALDWGVATPATARPVITWLPEIRR